MTTVFPISLLLLKYSLESNTKQFSTSGILVWCVLGNFAMQVIINAIFLFKAITKKSKSSSNIKAYKVKNSDIIF
jgi:hypothetical protein